MNNEANQPAATPDRAHRRRVPVPPPALTTALLATTAMVAALEPKLPPYFGDSCRIR